MQITDYQPSANDRFAGGYPAAPVGNSHPDFVGAGFDWTSVGWNSVNARVGYGFVSPRHHFVAKHFGSTNSRRIHGNDNLLHTVSQQATIDLGFGAVLETTGPDLSVTRLSAAMPATSGMPRYPVLDLNSTSTGNNPGNYNLREVLLYGHWGFEFPGGSPRIAKTTITSVTASGTDHSFDSSRTLAQLEGNDSGSPAFLVWTNPDGGKELAIIGNHAAVNATSNIHSFAGTHQVMAGINGVMTPDGYALRVVGEPTNTWVGSQSVSINNRRSWGLNAASSAPSDRFVTFNGATAGNGRQVNVNANHFLRGLYFRSTGSGAMGFRFDGTSTLTIGRGGIGNLDGSRQVFEAPVALGDHQYWDAGAGGVSVRNVATNGRLLNIRSAGPSVVRDAVSGGGGLALEGGRLHIEAASTYTGKTWAHSGELRVDGDISPSDRLVFGPSAVLTGHGKLPVVEGRGVIDPDGILTAASITPTQGIAFHFRFSPEGPGYGNASGSPSDLLRLTASPPFSTALASPSAANVYLTAAPPATAVSLRGGFFFDDASASAGLVTGAAWQVFVADPGGGVIHDGETYKPLDRGLTISFVPETAGFAEGAVDGLVMVLDIAPAEGTYEAWAALAFPEETPEAVRARDAIPLNDGVPNILAYALDLDPLADKSAGLPGAVRVEGELSFRFRKNTDAQDITMTVESSEDLIEWADVTAPAAIIDPDPDGDGTAVLLGTTIPPEPMETRRFARLRIGLPE
jgi:hypothetical protein